MLIAKIDADTKAHVFSGDTLAHGIGRMDRDAWEKTVETLVGQSAMKRTIDETKAFTDRYPAAANP